MPCSDVTEVVVVSGSGGPRKVEPAEARKAIQGVACQRSDAFGLKVEPTAPPYFS